MKANASSVGQLIELRLDLAFAFEALILKRLRRLPGCRREEWLRGLLVKGFQSECGSLRHLQRDARASSQAPSNQQLATMPAPISIVQHQASASGRRFSRPAAKASRAAQHTNNAAPLAALRQVIG